jgi:hypothetical protein
VRIRGSGNRILIEQSGKLLWCFLAAVKEMRWKSKEGNEDSSGKWTLQEVQRMLFLRMVLICGL